MTGTNAGHATDALVRQYARKVYNIAYRITANTQDAEDVTQETFVQVHRNLHKFRGESAPYTWIYRIAVNTGLRYRQHVKRAYVEGLDTTILEFRDDLPEDVRHWRNDPETRHIYDQLLTEVQQACYHFITSSLTDEQRVVYVLRVILGLPLDDIAEILEVKKNTVKSRLQRAKSSLRDYFSGRCQWIEGGGDCSCESRLGFALSAAPEIIQRLRDHPPNKDSKKMVRQTLEKVGGPDALFSRLPMLDYQVKSLEFYLS
jgi:RNA polymerase sigma-70 factor, ECF subfamily